MATFTVTIKADALKDANHSHLTVVFEGPKLVAPADPSEYSPGVFDSMGNRVGNWRVEGAAATEYFDGQMPDSAPNLAPNPRLTPNPADWTDQEFHEVMKFAEDRIAQQKDTP